MTSVDTALVLTKIYRRSRLLKVVYLNFRNSIKFW